MVHCLVLWCKNSGRIPGIHYFSLPERRHDKWMRAIGRDPSKEHLTPGNRICSKHFAQEDLVLMDSKIHVKPNAIPRLCLRKSEGILSCPGFRVLRELHHNVVAQESVDPEQLDCTEMMGEINMPSIEYHRNSGMGVTVSCTPTIDVTSSPLSVATTSSTSTPRSQGSGESSVDSVGNTGEVKKARREVKTRHNYRYGIAVFDK